MDRVHPARGPFNCSLTHLATWAADEATEVQLALEAGASDQAVNEGFDLLGCAWILVRRLTQSMVPADRIIAIAKWAEGQAARGRMIPDEQLEALLGAVALSSLRAGDYQDALFRATAPREESDDVER